MSELLIFVIGCFVGATGLYVYAKIAIAMAIISRQQKDDEQHVPDCPEYLLEQHSGQFMAYNAMTSKFVAQNSTLDGLVRQLSANGECNILTDDDDLIKKLRELVKE